MIFIKKGHKTNNKSASAPEWGKRFTYKIDEEYRKYYLYLFFTDDEKKLNVWFINRIEPSKQKGQGKRANQIFKSIFERINGVSERKAFGYCEREKIARCVPKQLYYIDESQKNKNIPHVSKIDKSSNYPAHLCGRVPTWQGHKEIAGTVKPSKEFPFAFYIKSGHSAEYGYYDTHKWLDTPLCMNLFGDNYDAHVDKPDDVTILCKASKYKYDDVIKEVYEKKQAGETYDGTPAKVVMNASIGFKHLSNKNNKQNRLDHVATVCLARANEDMLKDFRRGNTLMIVVDSIIYKGATERGENVAKLGKFKQEITDATFRMRGINQYAFEKDGKIIDICHGGFDSNLTTNRLEDIDKWGKKDIIKIKGV